MFDIEVMNTQEGIPNSPGPQDLREVKDPWRPHRRVV